MFKDSDNDFILILGFLAIIAIVYSCSACSDPGDDMTPIITQEAIFIDLFEEFEENRWQWYEFSDRTIDTIYVCINTETGGIDSVEVETKYSDHQVYATTNYTNQVGYNITMPDSSFYKLFIIIYEDLTYTEITSTTVRNDDNLWIDGITGKLLKL